MNLNLIIFLMFYMFNKSVCEILSPKLTNLAMVNRLIEFYTLQSDSNRSELCEHQAKLLYHAVYNSELWAKRIIDASSKIPNGVTKFHLFDFGYFDECIQVNDPVVSIKGKYCLTTVTVPENDIVNQVISKNEELSMYIENVFPKKNNSYMLKIKWAICVPNGCTANDVNNHLNTFAGIDIFKLDESTCHTVDTYKSKLNVGDWSVIVVVLILCVIMLLSTIYDVYLYYIKKEPLHSAFIAFSWFTNINKLIEINNNPDVMPCLNGIRFLSMLWIIYGHQEQEMYSYFNVNLLDKYQWTSKFLLMLINGYLVSVDSFLLLGGCLLMFGFLKMQAKKKKTCFNIPLYYLHRYIRLTPSYAAAIVFRLTIYRFLGSGPLWDPENLNDLCRTYWWAALLYIQNYVTDYMCIPVSWYLQVDMQLYILAPLLLLPIAKWPKITIYLLSSLVLIFLIIPTAIAWHYGFSINEQDIQYAHLYYCQIYTRAGPWILGLLLGYILFNKRNSKIVINKISATFYWIISIAIMLYTIFGYYHQIQPGYEYDRVFNSLFIGLHRVAWSAGLSWIIFACIHGYGGPVNWFLSLTIFQILSRLTYSIYLTHYWLQSVYGGSLQMPYIYSNMHVWYLVCGNLVTTLIISVFWTLTFETPFLVLDSLIIKRIGDTRSKRSEN